MRSVIEKFEKTFFVLIVCVAIIFLLISFLLTNTFKLSNLLAWILNELGLGLITSIIVIMSYERFLHIKTSLFNFRDKINIVLNERFPKNISEGVSTILDQTHLTENFRTFQLFLEETDEKDILASRLTMSYELVNFTDEYQIHKLSFNSHRINAPENALIKYRDGVYEISDIKLSVNDNIFIDTQNIPSSAKLSQIQSLNDKKDENYSLVYQFSKSLHIPPRGKALISTTSKRFIPKHNGVLFFHSMYPINKLTVEVVHNDREFLELLSYSFNTSTSEQFCHVSDIERISSKHKRIYKIDGGFFGHQGVKLRWV